jgi:hypothetical protein
MRRYALAGFFRMGLCLFGSALLLGGYMLGHLSVPPPAQEAPRPSPLPAFSSSSPPVAPAPPRAGETNCAPSPVLSQPAPAIAASPIEAPRTQPGTEPSTPPAVSGGAVAATASAPEETDRLQAILQQEAEREDAAAAESAARHATALDALDRLRSADMKLATGETDGIDGDLGNAEDALSGRSRVEIEAARTALAQSDLYQAREYIEAALAERHWP